jgi:peptide/nickel transport system permease protein
MSGFLRELRRSRTMAAGLTAIVAILFMMLIGPQLVRYDPYQQDLIGKLQKPSSTHWLGTDELGRDITARIVVGARYSILTSLAASLAAAIAGTVLGTVSGYFGGWLDTVIMRAMDVLLAMPGVLLAIAIIAALGTSIVNVVIAIGINYIPVFARLSRASTLTARQHDYVLAAHALGSGSSRIIMRHILPNIVSPLIVQLSLTLGAAMLLGAGLSFLGLGVQPPTPEWGSMLSTARVYIRTAPHATVIPGLAIFVTVIALNLFGDGLRDALDPRRRS